MSTDIRNAHTDEEHPRLEVLIAPHTLVAFCRLLSAEERRTGLSLASQGYRQRLVLPAFEVRVSPFALATFVRIFDYDEAMICLVEEAQFRGLCLTVRPLADGAADLSLSDTTDEQFSSEVWTISSTVPHHRRRPGRSEIQAPKPIPMSVRPHAARAVPPSDRTMMGPTVQPGST